MRAFSYILGVFVLSLTILGAQPMEQLKTETKIQILDQSRLFLEGKSNVNEFTCHCEQEFIPMTADFAVDGSSRIADFVSMQLKVHTQKLDCGHKIMNKDLQKTLQVDQYPFIEIKLDKVHLNTSQKPLDQYWTHYLAETSLSMVGKSCDFKIPVMARRVAAHTFQFKSFYEIRLSEFGIKAPTALLGAVKVKDTFIIRFDLYVKVQE
ncbi:MAG: hypothetical protein Sapg2KO_30500 [Saprospiraceae bacterium]